MTLLASVGYNHASGIRSFSDESTIKSPEETNRPQGGVKPLLGINQIQYREGATEQKDLLKRIQ